MGPEFLKAGFILTATIGFLLVNSNSREIVKLASKSIFKFTNRKKDDKFIAEGIKIK